MPGDWIAGEGQLLLDIQEYIRQGWLTPIMVFITHLAKAGIFWILVTLFLLARKDTRRTGIVVGFAMVIEVIVCNLILKNIVARPRPYEMIEQLICIVPHQWDYSFPSGHTGFSFAVSSTLPWMKVKKRYAIPLIVVAVLIGLSRLYVGVHWPTDVLAGMVVGCIAGAVAYFLYTRCLEKVLPKKMMGFVMEFSLADPFGKKAGKDSDRKAS